MAITIHFRGVGIFVTKDQTATEVLFPNAESRNPPDHKTNNGVILHADGWPAKPHYCGVLTVTNGSESRRSLLGRRVTFPEGDPTKVASNFRDMLPPLEACTNANEYRLRLLPERERETDRVGTRILIRGGEMTACDPALDVEFEMPAHHGTSGRRQKYAYDIIWKTDAETLSLGVRTFGGQEERPIELNGDTNEAYFYCFDEALPSKTALTKVEPSECTGTLTDHDFKWIYQLLDRENPAQGKWQDWLEGQEFPAPWTDCKRARARLAASGVALQPLPLIPVSTCYSTTFEDS